MPSPVSTLRCLTSRMGPFMPGLSRSESPMPTTRQPWLWSLVT
ncbi:unnamed protein product [Staurois parvus]|uniref:Uncharacterized protein n=1 Tax=Staurois parvus TaxID=386267 RepID=A0ABN9ENH4_9NEOB|nr:unnamed protein product [Staurois parvus]